MYMNHLTENQLALYVDALVSYNQDQLPEEILEHVEECPDCKVTAMWAFDHLSRISSSNLPSGL